jgi:ATP-dependent helicase/nuclease subunit B
MSATLYLAPTTGAVLTHIAETVRAVRRDQPLAPLTFLLPSSDAVRQLRRCLGDVIAVRPLQFYSLSAAILSETGATTREMNDVATRRLVRGVLARLNQRGELTTFASMLDKPGFIDVLVEWLREMKTQGITPEQVASYAKDGSERDRQLARVYTRYQAALAEGDCADADGLLWLAAEAVELDPRLLQSMGRLVMSGFDQFSPVQLRIVAALAERLPVTVYLLWDAARQESSLALSRLAPTRRNLLAALRPQEVVLHAVDGCGPCLSHLRGALFEPAALPLADDKACVAAIAAPSSEAEVRHALRRVKRLLLDGAREEHIALLAPHPGAYRPIVATVAREYGVPVAVESTVAENPCAAALLNLLALAPAFPWRQAFDALRSPYVKQSWLDADQIALLDALTRERPVIAGREQWDYALTRPCAEDDDQKAEDEDRGDPPLLMQLAPEAVGAIRAGLNAFFDHVTPPVDASPAQYVAWIQDALLGLEREGEDAEDEPDELPPSLRMVDAAEEGEWRERDFAALNALLRALREWLDADALVEELRLEPDDAVEPAQRRRELLEWLPGVPVRPDHRQAAVRFGPLEISRAVTVDHLFVLGLAEGEFPRAPQPDPFYTSAERASHPLPLVRTNSGEDASLWWQVLSNCQCSLTLLRPRLDPNGAKWLPSAYWNAVVGLVDGLTERVEVPRLVARPAVADAACGSELLEALACGDAAAAPPELAGPWRAVTTARTVAQLRDGWQAPAADEGVLTDATVVAETRRRYRSGRSWSVSRLNRFGVCPYAFLAQYGLKLEAIADPVEGMSAQQRGSLVHKILEVLFARLMAANIGPSVEATEAIQALLDQVCDELLPRAAERYGFRPGPLWEREQAELRNELGAYMVWECEPGQVGRFRPYRQELSFGLGGKGAYGPVEIIRPGADVLSLRGVIDRIDRDDDGRLRVIDYKTGSKRYSPKEIAAGRALQSALYAWAVARLIPDSGGVLVTAYRHTGSREQSGAIQCHSEEGAALIEQAAARAVGFAQAAREGWFAPLPSRGSAGRACSEKCDFLGLCRVTRHGVRKAQQHAPLAPGLAGAAAQGGEA